MRGSCGFSSQSNVKNRQQDPPDHAGTIEHAGDQKVLLYELIVGENGTGFELGSVPDKNGDRQKVWININAIDRDESWSDDEFNEVCTLQDGVNDLLDQIYQIDGFKKPEE